MTNASEDRALRGRMQRLETLLQEMGRFADPAARTASQEIVQTLLDFHGAGLGRILDYLGDSDPALIAKLGQDELVGSLLLLYGLHPFDLETRVRQALEKVRPALRAHGGNVELLDLVDGVARLRMLESCHGCPSSAATLRQTIEEAIYDAAPDVAAIEVEDAAEPVTTSATTFVPVEQLVVLARAPA